MKSVHRAIFQLFLAILGFISWSLFVFCLNSFEFLSWYFITRAACISTPFWTVNMFIAFEVLCFPMNQFYLLWRINRELFNFVFNIFMGLALIGYSIYLVIIWYPDESSKNEFFLIEISFFERSYEIYILMAAVLLCMLTGVCGISYGIWCIVLYRYYVKRKGERGTATNPNTLRQYYLNVEKNRQN